MLNSKASGHTASCEMRDWDRYSRTVASTASSTSTANWSSGLVNKNVGPTKTVSVNVVWATSSKQPDELIYNVTAALWNAATRNPIWATLRDARSRLIGFQGLGIPLHVRVKKLYKEPGLVR
jgi:TRAP-type uncharacterized transport system substrate-binding protein